MIARLRARHARVWGALLLVVPVVLGAALSVRRGEAVRQELPVGLRAESSVVSGDLRAASESNVLEWREPVARKKEHVPSTVRAWRDEAGHLVLEITCGSERASANCLLYWTSDLSRELHAQLAGMVSAFDRVDVHELELPQDAVLLGAWPAQDAGWFVAPQEFSKPHGAFLLFDLGQAQLENAALVPRFEVSP